MLLVCTITEKELVQLCKMMVMFNRILIDKAEQMSLFVMVVVHHLVTIMETIAQELLWEQVTQILRQKVWQMELFFILWVIVLEIILIQVLFHYFILIMMLQLLLLLTVMVVMLVILHQLVILMSKQHFTLHLFMFFLQEMMVVQTVVMVLVLDGGMLREDISKVRM